MNRCIDFVLLVLASTVMCYAQDVPPKPTAIDVAQQSTATNESEPEGVARGDRRLQGTQLSPVYRKKWALVVGINYEDRGDTRSTAVDAETLPPLSNAVKDAKVIADILREYYAFEEENVVQLIEEQATKTAIEEAIGAFCDSSRVSAEDCVFVFFSGHGVRSNRGTSFLAHNVHLAQGSPVSGHLRLHEDIVGRLEDCPAKHKLLVLDHCYSGDVFNRNFQPPSMQDRSDRALMREQAFQAIASCRATQVALDAGQLNQGHSPFTAAMIDGLTRIPANGRPSEPIGITKLASYISTTFDVETQKPECRSLISTEGEFSFWPAEVSFDQFRVKPGDRNLLNAMTSRHSDWWFNERPWFIPRVRNLILEQLAASQKLPRGAVIDQHIDEMALRVAAEKAFDLRKGSYDESTKRYYDMLLSTQGTNKFQDSLQEIGSELEARLTAWKLADSDSAEKLAMNEEDIHLLALVQHALKKSEEAHETYRLAEQAYAAKKDSSPTQDRISAALCAADHGELLLEEMGKANEAADKFREAEAGIRMLTEERDAGAVFRMSAMCREANAYLRINRWKAANRLLQDALALTENFAPGSYFAAQVYRNHAWAQIIQWRMLEAKTSFERSNEILARLFEREAERQEEESDAAVIPEPVLEASNFPAAQFAFRNLGDSTAFQQSQDFASKLALLHNLHGIAMVQRFQGDTINASQNYRSLARHVEATFSDLTQGVASDTLTRMYVVRSINTQERLGDCNLFGDPAYTDIKEAIDDYRRARNMVHRLAGMHRRQVEAVLLYKMAIAMALPSEIRDTEMAVEICKRADEMFAEDEKARIATGQYWVLGKLTTAMVELLAQKACLIGDEVPCVEPASNLRDSILSCRDILGQYPHRDQLEILLFASMVLLEHSPAEDRFQIAENSDLLLTFCRLALSSHQFDAEQAGCESTAYLRPYYDSVMRAKLAIPGRRQVLDLLEIQAEATTGMRYMKSEDAQPILATYVVDNECYLMLDLPRGTSQVFPLASIYDPKAIQNACFGGDRLTLPGEILGELNRWLADNHARTADGTHTENVRIDVRWIDPVRRLQPSLKVAASTGDESHISMRVAGDIPCPFVLPAGFRERDATQDDEQTSPPAGQQKLLGGIR